MTKAKTGYLYVELWPNGRAYIGQTQNPDHRHRQHVGELIRGSENIKREIVKQGGFLPKMNVLAVFDMDVKYDCGSYEQIITQSAKVAGWDLIYEGGWLLSLEARAKGGRIAGPINIRKMPREAMVRGGRKGGRIAGKMKTPAQQHACRENLKKVSIETRRENGRKNIRKISKEAKAKGGRMNTPAQLITRRENARKHNRKIAKLTSHQVCEIRRRFEAGESGLSIARDFPVNWSTMYAIKDGRKYAWV